MLFAGWKVSSVKNGAKGVEHTHYTMQTDQDNFFIHCVILSHALSRPFTNKTYKKKEIKGDIMVFFWANFATQKATNSEKNYH